MPDGSLDKAVLSFRTRLTECIMPADDTLNSISVTSVLLSSSDNVTLFMAILLSFFLSERPPLECCCVHNVSPFILSSGLSPGSREAKV